MAADILLYRANVVPVGEDQTQHLELVRLLAARFNTVLGETFPIPSALIKRQGARIMGLDDPARKMSKTAPPHNHIALTDTPDAIREKIRKAVTDPGKEIVLRPDKPAISNLLTIYSLFAMKAVPEIEEMYRGKSYLAFKNDLADLIIDALCPFQEALASIGEERAREVLARRSRQSKEDSNRDDPGGEGEGRPSHAGLGTPLLAISCVPYHCRRAWHRRRSAYRSSLRSSRFPE